MTITERPKTLRQALAFLSVASQEDVPKLLAIILREMMLARGIELDLEIKYDE